MEIVNLKNNSKHAQTIYKWLKSAWGDNTEIIKYLDETYIKGISADTFIESCKNPTNQGNNTKEEFPTILVAIENETAVGTVSILKDDMENIHKGNIWLGCLYVDEKYRQNYISTILIATCIREAKKMDIETLYSYTSKVYLFKDWEYIETREFEGTQVVINKKKLGSDNKDLTQKIENDIPFEIYNAFFNNNNLSFFVSDKEYKIVYWNKGAEKIYGYSADCIVNENYIDKIVTNENKDKAKEDDDEVINSGNPQSLIIDDKNKDGESFKMSIQCFRIKHNNKYLKGEIGININSIEDQVKKHNDLIKQQYKIFHTSKEECNKYLIQLELNINKYKTTTKTRLDQKLTKNEISSKKYNEELNNSNIIYNNAFNKIKAYINKLPSIKTKSDIDSLYKTIKKDDDIHLEQDE